MININLKFDNILFLSHTIVMITPFQILIF